MKPLARWTIGPVTDAGIECLVRSVAKFKQIYPEFDRVICHNGLGKRAEKLPNNCFILEQDPYAFAFPPLEDNWKFYPPRLRKSCKELFIDNDLVINERMPSIDKFLNSDFVLMTEGLMQNFGCLTNKLPAQDPANAGIVGLPEHLDLGQVIVEHLQGWKTRFDNQGIAVLAAKGKLIIAGRKEVGLYLPENKIDWNAKAHHFLRLNATEEHTAWKEFMTKMQSVYI